MKLADEKKLILQAKKDPRAFGILYDHYFPPILGYIYKRVLDKDQAHDIASETFLKAYSKLWQFRWKSVSISSWLYRIATNEVNSYFRSKRYQTISLNELRRTTQFDFPDPTSLAIEKERIATQTEAYKDLLRIQQAIRTLPVHYQEVITLRYLEKKSVKEVASILNKKEGTVKSLLSRGMEKLRQLV